MVSTRPVGSRRNLDPFDCGEPASPERDRGEIDRTVQLHTMDWRAGQPARSCHGRIPSAIWALDLLGGSRRVERGAARFFDVLGGNLAAPPAAGPAAIRSPGWPPSNDNFSRARAMRECAGGGAEAVYMRMRDDTRAESTIKWAPGPPNPSNAAHITPRLPQPRAPSACPASRESVGYHFGPRGKLWGGPVARAGLESTHFNKKSRFDEI